MRDWNVVITVQDAHFTRVRQLLQRYGRVKRTDFYNVLVMKVEDIEAFQEAFTDQVARTPEVLQLIGRVMPASAFFAFQSAEDFEAKAREIVLGLSSRLRGRSFHARMHRRGFKEALPSQQEERMLNVALLEALERAGEPGRIDFEDPDFILDIETVGQRAGISLWSREDLERCPFLKLD